jgi:prepilin-type N-terminal cleavage/methylation domain-containing protein
MMNLDRKVNGFTLVEMAIVLAILGFVLAALLLPLQAQRDLTFQNETETTLENARKALLGFAQSNGRLPCPATAASNGREQPLGGTDAHAATANTPQCTQQVGFLPAATLGLQPTDAQGFLLDGWRNRMRYAVSQSNAGAAASADFTSNVADDTTTAANEADGMNVVGLANLTPEIRVCATSVGITAIACSGAPEVNFAINNAVAVIYSLGATGAQAVGGADETANLNDADVNGIIDDVVFVSHDQVTTGANAFDHIVVWISPFTLYNAMIQAGQLH